MDLVAKLSALRKLFHSPQHLRFIFNFRATKNGGGKWLFPITLSFTLQHDHVGGLAKLIGRFIMTKSSFLGGNGHIHGFCDLASFDALNDERDALFVAMIASSTRVRLQLRDDPSLSASFVLLYASLDLLVEEALFVGKPDQYSLVRFSSEELDPRSSKRKLTGLDRGERRIGQS
jgi:hypothetical protein